ncbi:MAG: hypothetical protein JW995_11295 [Melioribacteraceae bacterium]|nr:hypothetical protein [Melioribacteraceae bacterium]
MTIIIKKINLLVMLLIISGTINAQFSKFNFGGYIGFGNISGNSPAQTSVAGSFSFGLNHIWMGDADLRLNYLFAKKATYFLPENTKGRYYPELQAFSFKAVIEQELNRQIFVEEGLGLVAINDKTFSDINEWGYGVAASVMLGWDLRSVDKTGIKLGVSGETALTFTSVTASYFFVTAQILYYL